MASSTSAYSFTDDDVSHLANCNDQAEFLHFFQRILQSKSIDLTLPSMLKLHSVLPLTMVPLSLRGSLRLSLTRWAMLSFQILKLSDNW